MAYTVHQAKTHFSRLLREAEAGQDAAEMGGVEDGWRFTASYVPQCMRPVQDLELEAPQLFTLPPPYDRIARGEAELQLQAALDDPIPM